MKHLWADIAGHRMPRPWDWLFCGLIGCALTGCGSLPSSGPSISNIEDGAHTEKGGGNYAFIPVTQEVVDALGKQEADASESGLSTLAAPVSTIKSGGGFRGVDQLQGVEAQKIGIGDVVGVSIYSSGGVFSGGDSSSAAPSGGSANNATSLPAQLVGSSGKITVPFVGRVPVVGRLPSEVEDDINEGLKGKAVSPYTVVTIQDRRGSDLVTVSGDVKSPQRIAVPLSGLRVVDAIAAAGGSIGRQYETDVTVLRGRTTRSDIYGEILKSPVKNIFLQPGDTVLLSSKPWQYVVFGATNQDPERPAILAFPSSDLNAAEALGGANGLNDYRANPEAFFVYRFESPSVLKALGVPYGAVTSSGVPVVYQINLRVAGGFFMAEQFAIRNNDVLFAGDAGTLGVTKVMGIINALTSPLTQGATVATGVGTIRALQNH